MSRTITFIYKIPFFVFFLLMGYTGFSQKMKLEIVGGGTIAANSTTTLSAGTSLDFRITNIETNNCNDLDIKNIFLTNSPTFGGYGSIGKIKPEDCYPWWYYWINTSLNFTISNDIVTCGIASTIITIKIRNKPDFVFTLQVNASPVISVLGGSPQADIIQNSTTTSATNGTFFGTAEGGATRTRNYIISNTGSCPLTISGVTSSGADFTPATFVFRPNNTTSNFPVVVASGTYVVLPISFLGPNGGTGSKISTISLLNDDNTSFNFKVSAEMFNENIPGPGGITSDFKLWLKATRGITKDGSSKVSKWADLGTNPKNAIADSGKEPTYIDDKTNNINFNPVIDFKNSGVTEQFMYNAETPSGFYSADIFIVMVPDVDMNSGSTKNTILAGVQSGATGDITGVGFGIYSTAFTNEVLSYNQNIPTPISGFNGAAQESTTKSYSGAGIINVTNNVATSPTAQEILYNSIPITTKQSIHSFSNITGSKYWIGKNFGETANLNGRVAEIFTFGTKLDATSRLKVESYLAIKYGITLGALNVATKDYMNSFDTKVWNTATSTGYNNDVAAIGKDTESDLNQKQSKSVNTLNEVTIGLGGIFSTNSANPNQFTNDGDFLAWGNNGGNFSGSATNTVTLGSFVTTSLTRIDRKWKIVESTQVVSDVGNVYVGIPLGAFSGFTKNSNEEYALIVADDTDFNAIIDVIPLRPDANNNLFNWYNFDGTKYFSFGKVSKSTGSNKALNLVANEYLLGDLEINLNVNDFTISAWVKTDAAQTGYRNIMSKGEKLQMRLNDSEQVEIVMDGATRFTSTMTLSDNKWHQITFVYDSGTVFLYIDGVLDKSEQNVVAPSPNFNNYCIGALYVNKNNISNYFLGEIDEVYIWDKGLSQSQVRYLMNQEAQRVSGSPDKVSGKFIPSGTLNNEVISIDWSKLKVYYDFNAFYGSTIEGQANSQGSTTDRYFIRINYGNNNKQVLEPQTAPLPYISIQNGDFDDEATWANGSDYMLPNSLSLDNVTKISWNIAKINNEITSGDNDIALLGLVVENTGKLIIANSLETTPNEDNSGQGLLVSHYLELDGVIDLVGESQLLQSEGSILDTDSGGYINRDQQGTANGYNYNYWSSSVGPISSNLAATKGNGVPTTNENIAIKDFLYDGSPLAPDGSKVLFNTVDFEFEPTGPVGATRTIFTRWLYSFYGEADNYNAWRKIDQNTPLFAGEGYTMKGPLGSAPIATKQNYVFKGLPNNGDITLEIDKSLEDKERLLGNPYPSAMDAQAFILDNISTAEGGNNTNGNVINGALYFWDHFGKEDTHYLSGYVGGYATYNLTGGAKAISNDVRISNTGASGTKIPGRYIPVNQGFFVTTKLEANPNNNDPIVDIAQVDGGTIVFKNSQRVFVTEFQESSPGIPASVFMKSSKGKTTTNATNNYLKDNTPTIRLMYDSPLGFHRQIVLGATINATQNFDLGYDAVMVDVNEEDMYWKLSNNKLVIQGVDVFDTSKEFPLGLIVKKAGAVSIKLDALENLDANIPIFIRDNLKNEAHKITNNAFDIVLQPGNYNDRFTLVFQDSGALNTDDIDLNINNILVYYDADASELKLINKQVMQVRNINLYNILGQNINEFKVNSSKNESIPLRIATGVYIVKLTTENGSVSKKIIVE